MECEIIAIGTEVVTGDIVNTNAPYIANFLKGYGVQTLRHTAVLDDKNTIVNAIKDAHTRTELVITTGGLGPTYDDISKESVAEAFGLDMELHKESLAKIEGFFKKLNRPMTQSNVKQAYFPKDSVIIENNNGTAPGSITEKDGKIVIMLPGPPVEALPMLSSETVKNFFIKNQNGVIYEHTLRVMGIGESSLEGMLLEYMKEGQNPLLAPYAKTGEVHLKITAKAENFDKAKKMAYKLKEKIYKIIGDNIYAENKQCLEEVVVKLLNEKSLTISTAEFLTGGLLSSMINAVAGSEKVFNYGYVNNAKMVINEETAKEMAVSIREISKSSIGISILGEVSESTNWLVYIGLSTKENTIVKELNLLGNMEKIKDLAIKNALNMVRTI